MNQINKSVFLILVLLCFSVLSKGQIVQFERLDMSDGLSSSTVYCINQDQYGFIWVGTNNGLNIYNGIEFKHFFSEPGNTASLSGNVIVQVVFDGDTAFVATSSGLCMMDVVTKKCTRINIGANEGVGTLFLDKESGILWIGTQAGLLKYTISTKQIKAFNSTNSNISHDIIRSIYNDSAGNLWVGTFDHLNKLPPNSHVFEQVYFPESNKQNIMNNLILSIAPYKPHNDSLLWVGMQTGLALYDRIRHKTIKFIDERHSLTNSVVKDIHSSSTGKVWLGTDLGLAELENDKVKDVHFHDPFKSSSLTNSVVWDIYEDNSGTLWFGTDNGMTVLPGNTERFSFYPMVFEASGVRSGYDIRSITEDKKQQLWMASQKGFIQYNQGTKLLMSYNSESPLFSDVNHLLEDSEGRIWGATNGGISLYNPISNSLQNISATHREGNGLRSDYIYGFCKTSIGDIFVNTSAGLHKVIHKQGNISFEFLGKISIRGESKNYLIAESFNSSLLQVNPETFETKEILVNPYKNKGEYFQSVLVDSTDNNIWIGYNKGLMRFNTDSDQHHFFEIQSDKRYPLFNLIKDDEGNIWATTYTEIIKFSPGTSEFEIYPASEGISVSRFISGSYSKCSNGDLLFGGQDGYIRFAPGAITKSAYNPPLRLTKLIIANEVITPATKIKDKSILSNDISFTDEITLDYIDGSFAVEFSSLHYGSRGGVKYKYKLEGEDKDWQYIDTKNGRAGYSRLKSGSYVLRVKGTNNDGVWNEDEQTLKIKIKPPLWASTYFVSLYIVIIILIISFLMFNYRRKLQWKNQMEIVSIEKEHTETVAKNRQQFFTNVAHEFRTPLNLIIGPLEKLITNQSIDQEGKSLATIVERNARRLLWLNNQFLDLRKLENKTISMTIADFEMVGFLHKVYLLFTEQADSHGIRYTFNNEIEAVDVKMDLRKVETIVFNLLANAFKYTADNEEITFKISHEEKNGDECVVISIKDTGPGISSDEQAKIFNRFYRTKDNDKGGLGIGLNLVKEYTIMHHGEVHLISEKDKGAEFIVTLPINGHYPSGEVNTEDELQPLLKSKALNGINKTSSVFSDQSYNVLLVEDDKELADFLLLSLSKKYNVEVTSNGEEALASIANKIPDLVISDLSMPKMNGAELTKRLKSNVKTSHIPIIILTGQTEKECQMKALKEGANAYLLKPIEIDLLELRISNFLKRGEQLEEHIKVNELSKPKEIKVSSQDEKILEKVVRCIEKHISDPNLNIEKVCDECGFSHTFLYRKIKKLTGQTLNELIRTVRLKRAEQLFRTEKLSVTEVMHETGFSNHSYFAKCFKKVYNKTPKEYLQDS